MLNRFNLAKKLELSLANIIIIAFIIFAGFPIFWMFLTSIRSADELFKLPLMYIPKKLTLDHYKIVLGSGYENLMGSAQFGYWIFNTTFVSVSTTLICLVLGSGAGYALARGNFKYSNVILMIILGFRLFPPMSMLPSFYYIFYHLGLLNSLVVLVITNTYLQLPIAIWLIRGFFIGIPKDFEDAARVDGCSRFQAFIRILFPLAGPGIAAAAILIFLMTWNEFLFGVTLASSSEETTVISAGVYRFVGDVGIAWNRLSAAGTVAGIPAIIFVVFFQKYIVRGLLAGSLKQ